MIICIIANGQMEDYSWHKNYIQKANLIICADGGANHAFAMEITPDYIIGDLDSVQTEVLEHYSKMGVKIIRFPKEKDDTDTQLTIKKALKYQPKEIIIVGALGKRLDHTISNIMQLSAFIASGINIKIVDSYQEVFLMGPGETTIKGAIGDIISLLPLTPLVTGIKTDGLQYLIKDGVLTQSNPYGISNVFTKNQAKISQEMGMLLAIKIIKE